MDYMNILLGLLVAYFLVHGVVINFSLRRSKRVAPGPFPLPIIGNLHLLGDKPHISLAQLAKKHGPIMNIMVEAGKPNLVDYLPFLEKIDPQGRRRCLTIHFTKVLQLMSGSVDERLNERKLGNHENVDILDSLLNICPQEIDRNHIEHLILDLFVAGTDATSNTFEWAMAELLKNPHILEKAQEELAQVIGKGKLIDEADVAKLPYLRCIVKETLRIHPQAPFLIPRKAEEDVELCGYIIPKDSQVFVNVWAIGHDSSLWEDPLDFKPERFWESDMDVRGRDFQLIPFGAGRRICPGLPLAIRMAPVTLGSILNTFNWKLYGGNIAPKDLDMEEKFGLTYTGKSSTSVSYPCSTVEVGINLRF